MVDLHIHTYYSSDGLYSPEEIMKMAMSKGITTLSFTDHNEIKANFEGVSLARHWGIKFIPGVEFNSFWEGKDIHVLGYYLDYGANVVREFIEELKGKKFKQTVERVKKLSELGFHITLEDVLEETKNRPATGVSFLKAMLKRKENHSDSRLFPYIKGDKSRSPFMNFYNDYLTPGKPAFVELKDAPTDEVIKLIIDCNGIPVIAHPKDLEVEDLKRLKSYGALGLEAFSSYHSEEKKAFYLQIAHELDMIVTAGSDFHGESIKKDVHLGDVGVLPIDVVKLLEQLYWEKYGKKPCYL